jgi:hypothetical protein
MKKITSAKVKAAARLALLRAGRHVSSAQLEGFRPALSYLELGHWLKSDYIHCSPEPVASKFALFEIAHRAGQCAGGHSTCLSQTRPWSASTASKDFRKIGVRAGNPDIQDRGAAAN